jgi:hypothetical protein
MRSWIGKLGRHLNSTVNGHPVERLRSRLTASMNAWTEEDVTVEGDGINFNIGCIAPKTSFPIPNHCVRRCGNRGEFTGDESEKPDGLQVAVLTAIAALLWRAVGVDCMGAD